ncbi:alpha/beta fold hydrolase [Nocardioides sp. SYSU D00038]|uniref:alpha/beta fold hydrolase n=1 Tax=Nocardioides sp. SYSU D00038 TaxID=2812554 RepID=UPI0019678323|nr:alpha/beta hydrolase [Nocardioides sp. SYSU D00038]
MSYTERFNVSVSGAANGPAMVFAHGFGCDQRMWRHVVPEFEPDHRVVLFDLPGMGGSVPDSYDVERHASLDGYADDLVDLLRELDLGPALLVAHSVSAMISVLVQQRAPELVERLVLVGPSARYLDDDGYQGGFARQDVLDLLDLMENNHFGWQAPLAGMVMGDPDAPHLTAEMEDNFCRTRPEVARRFAAVTFLGDNRADLPGVTVPTLVLQCERDSIAPVSAGRYVAESIPDARLVLLDTTGHCPQLSVPDATSQAIRSFLTP